MEPEVEAAIKLINAQVSLAEAARQLGLGRSTDYEYELVGVSNSSSGRLQGQNRGPSVTFIVRVANGSNAPHAPTRFAGRVAWFRDGTIGIGLERFETAI